MNPDDHPIQPREGPAAELVAIGEREGVLAEYQATMQRFLETQQNVMLAYLSGSAGAHRPARPAIEMSRPRLTVQRSAAVVVPTTAPSFSSRKKITP